MHLWNRCVSLSIFGTYILLANTIEIVQVFCFLLCTSNPETSGGQSQRLTYPALLFPDLLSPLAIVHFHVQGC